MNRRSKGFTLTELLTALVIHSFFILMLGGTFYTLISFGSRSQMLMTARERGQRVLNYIDSRVRRVGLGMWKLKSSSEFRDSLKKLTQGDKAFYHKDLKNITLPVIIMHDYQDNIATNGVNIEEINSYDNILHGNVLTLLYAEREHDNEKNLTLTINNGGYATISDDKLNKLPDNATVLTDTIFQQIQQKINGLYSGMTVDEIGNKALEGFWQDFFDYGLTTAKKSFDINIYNSVSGNPYQSLLKSIFDMYNVAENNFSAQSEPLKNMLKDLLKYVTKPALEQFINPVISVLEEYSAPEFVHEFLSGKKEYSNSGFKDGDNSDYDIRSYGVMRGTGLPIHVLEDRLETRGKICSGDELLYLKSVRVFADEPRTTDPNKERNLKVQKLNDVKWGTNNSSANPYQQGILELYAELYQKENILSVWVLSTGGRDNMTHECPKDWPGRWREKGDNNDYKYFVTYVSKGTWKLNNLPEDFTWY